MVNVIIVNAGGTNNVEIIRASLSLFIFKIWCAELTKKTFYKYRKI